MMVKDAALVVAAENGQTDTVGALLDTGANVHAKEDWALRWAAKNGHVDSATRTKFSSRAA